MYVHIHMYMHNEILVSGCKASTVPEHSGTHDLLHVARYTSTWGSSN